MAMGEIPLAFLDDTGQNSSSFYQGLPQISQVIWVKTLGKTLLNNQP